MPQVDLSPLFTPPPKDRTSRSEPSLFPGWKDSQSIAPTERPSRVKLSLSQITNVGFVLAACLGAAISALYFIRGAELFQDVSAWPRELFYGRPVSRPVAAPVVVPVTTSSKDESGDPFSPTSKLLNLNSPIPTGNQPNRVPAPFSNSAPLSDLAMPAPAGDALSRSLIQNLPAPAAPAATVTSNVGQAAASKLQQQTSPAAKEVIGRFKGGKTKSNSRAGSTRTHSARTKLNSKAGSRRTRWAHTRTNSKGTGRMRLAGVKLKSKSAFGWMRRMSSRPAGTSTNQGVTVAELGSHIGALSQPVGPPPTVGALGSRAAMTRSTGGARISNMNSVSGLGRPRGH